MTDDVTIRGHTLCKGQSVSFVYDEMLKQHGTTFPLGFGPRRCPGAAIGTTVVASLVAATVMRYRLRPVQPSPTINTCLSEAWYACIGALTDDNVMTCLKPCYVAMEPRH